MTAYRAKRSRAISLMSIALSTTALVGLVLPETADAQETWVGGTSGDWFDSTNWNPGAVPTASTDVVINTAAPNQAVVNGGSASAQTLFVGRDAGSTGTLAILNGGAVSNADTGIVGNAAGSAGTVTVDGAGSTWTNSQSLVIGAHGVGILNIQNGGAVTFAGGGDLVLGNFVPGSGTVTVDGLGSKLTGSGKAQVGLNGHGVLTISNGGAVSNGDGVIGSFVSSTGTVTVKDAGSSWTNSGLLTVGDKGTGTLNIQNGGTVSNADTGIVGNAADSAGTVTVDGAGSTWTNSQSLAIGAHGVGILNIQNGGAVTFAGGGDLVLGNFVPGSGTVTVDGLGSQLTGSGKAQIGLNGHGALTISNGGAVSNGDGVIGSFVSSTGTVTVKDAGSSWINSGLLTVGDKGTGALNIQNGGTVSNVDTGIVGNTAGSNGVVTVNGVGSTWTNSSSLMVGQSGTGSLTVSNGGAVSNAGDAALGFMSGSTGTATITGPGSVWTSNGAFFYVGNNGTGTLTLSNGGVVANAGDAAVAFSAISTSTATVDGVGSKWTNGGILTVGRDGIGTLNVTNGGAVANTNGVIGSAAGSSGVVKVDGAGSTWANSSSLLVGQSGAGSLTVSNGGAVSNIGDAALGFMSGSTGTATITGPGSVWTSNGAFFYVGNNGIGTLAVSNGGVVANAGDAAVAFSAISTSAATVNGVGSKWTNGGILTVGRDGIGTLNITNGGEVSGASGILGDSVGSTGTATVDGAGSTFASTGNLIVGLDGTGAVKITAGGTASDVDGTVGYHVGSIGTAIVDGAGSSWENSGALELGRSGNGTLTISNGGVVSSSGTVLIAGQGAATGTLNIGGAAGSPATAAGTLNASNIQFGLGSGTINFNHTETNYTFAPVIGGDGTINQLAGNTNLTADNSAFTGDTNVTGGRLAVNGSLANSIVTVSGGGILGGTGTVGGIVAKSGGIVGPGNSIGTLNVNGNVSFASGSTYQLEVDTAGQSDKIAASGTATLNGGTVLVTGVSGASALGMHYTILTAGGGVTGAFDGAGAASATPFLTYGLSYDPNNVYLDISRSNVTFGSVGLTPNQVAAGGGAENLGLGNSIYDAVLGLSGDQARDAFDQLSGEIHASARTALIEDSRFLRSAVNDRIRAAFDSVGASGDTVVTYDDGKPRAAAATTDGLAVWSQGFGSWGHTEGDGNA
ncbi:beta strand repeat-containing protein, partial [Rhizobium leguminosarum]